MTSLERKDSKDIFKSVKEEVEKIETLLSADGMGAKDRDIVVFLGNTGSGKSTLVNFLAGIELRVDEEGSNYVLANPEDPAAMVIGLTGTSETLRPKSIDVGNLRYFDVPGFNDTDGSERNLVNAALIKRILMRNKSVRLVFVAGYGQFDNRAEAVKRMFSSLKEVFVTDEDENLVDKGMLIVTKVGPKPPFNLTKFLLQKTTDPKDMGLYTQIDKWAKRGNNPHLSGTGPNESALELMYAADRDEGNTQDKRREIVSCIERADPINILDVNIGALYPPETKSDLQRMFGFVMEDAHQSKKTEELALRFLSQIDAAIADHERDPADYWESFFTELCDDPAVELIKEFSTNPFNEAKIAFKNDFEVRRQEHLIILREKRTSLIASIKERTEERTDSVITEITPNLPVMDPREFDHCGVSPLTFAVYHKDFWNEVCGPQFIERLAIDPLEKKLVEQFCAGHLNHRSKSDMDAWFDKRAAMDPRYSALEEKLKQSDARYAVLEERLRISEAQYGLLEEEVRTKKGKRKGGGGGGGGGALPTPDPFLRVLTEASSLIESAHPCGNDENIFREVAFVGAKSYRIVFDPKTNIDEDDRIV